MTDSESVVSRDHGASPRRWPPTRETVEAAVAGDDAALGAILALGFPKLVAFYRGMGLRHADAEDVASEACEGVVRNLPRLRDPASFEAWFWTIGRNRFRTRLRKKGRIERELDPGAVSDPSDAAIASEEHAFIREALAQLSDRDRSILWLREVEQLSHDEISGRLGIATGAVRVAALRARRRLEEFYRERAGEESP
jgi:RNA polymerase sigma-70 factor (ECF subfamily)